MKNKLEISNSSIKYKWPDAYKAAVVVSVDVDAESPFIWNNRGQKTTVLSELEQRRFGPRQGLYRLVELLEKFESKGSFYVPGFVMEKYPHIVPSLLAKGHEVALHGYYHERMETLSDQEFQNVMQHSIDRFLSQGGKLPVGFRSPAWELNNTQLDYFNSKEIAYDSSLMGFEHPYTINGVTEVPVHWSIDDAIFFRYYGDSRDISPPTCPKQLLESWKFEFDAVMETGGLFMVTLHPWLSGRSSRLEMLRQLFAYIKSNKDVWWTTAAKIAQWHKESSNVDYFSVDATSVETDMLMEESISR
jgi:peptidoglycan/xylan/chitin deacetylase (PgdA/CDA1 family)